MFIECRHILPSGYKCRAAALRGQPYCYFHTSLRRYGETRTPDGKQEPVLFPSIEDTRGVQIAISQVIAALGARRIDPDNAKLYLSALRLAAQLADRHPEAPSKTVRALCYENDGDTLAPQKVTCEPPDDCVDCKSRNLCDRFDLYQDEVEELESASEDDPDENDPND